MPNEPKPRPVGRPKLPKGHAKSGVIQVRLNPDTRNRLDLAAKAKGLNISELIRSTLEASLNG